MSVNPSRSSVVRQIQRTRLGGAEPITLDRIDGEPWERFAHIYRSEVGIVTLHDTSTTEPDEVYATDSTWTPVGVIDLVVEEVSTHA